MKIALGSGQLCLTENNPLRLEKAQGLLIRCTAGVIWITVAGEVTDIFLHTGESYLIPRHGPVLLEAIGNGRIVIAPASSKPRPWHSGLLSRLAGRGETPVTLALSIP